MEFQTTTLDNGLTIVAEVSPAAASMAVGFFARTGSRDETPEINGVSHFLEHMMFKGTDRRTAFDVNLEFDRMGASYNAFTSEEVTVYYAAVLPEFQPRAVDLLGDMLRPALRDDDFETEKNVILEEIALYEDQPQFRVYERLFQEYFAGQALDQIVLGTVDSIGALTAAQMREYFARRYAADNVTVVATGNLDFDALVEQVKTSCGHWQRSGATREPVTDPAHRRKQVLVDAKLKRQNVGLMSPAPAAQSDQRHAAKLLGAVLGDDTGSRLFYALVEPAIAEDASVIYDAMDGVGAMLTFISADPPRAREAVDIALAEFARFADEGPTAEELSAAKNKIASASVLSGELPMGRLTSVGLEWVYRGQYTPLAEQIDEVLAVPAEAVTDVARQCDLTHPTIVTLGPLEQL